MTLLFVIGIIFLAGAAALVTRALTLSRIRMSAQMREIESYGYNGPEVIADPAPGVSGLRAALNTLAARVGQRVQGRAWRAPVGQVKLRAAALYTVDPDVFHGYRVMATFTVPPFLLLVTLKSGSFSPSRLLMILLTAGLCWFGPALLVERRAQRRMDLIDRDLPELIDLLTATIEAGLGFAGSLQLVADRFHGPLGQELRLTLHEQSMGLSTQQALDNLLERCETPSVRAFARAVSQGESLGVSIGTMMRNLAAETRKRRRQTATEKVQKAPVKMLFPLIFFIFPALFIVLLYPALSRVVEQLGGG
ncbi:MAG: type II secretion system F family protein [Actinobacteria bacterium]|nr:MAG: type II secretion system F family protein [Actinomycetota bacterium]